MTWEDKCEEAATHTVTIDAFEMRGNTIWDPMRGRVGCEMSAADGRINGDSEIVIKLDSGLDQEDVVYLLEKFIEAVKGGEFSGIEPCEDDERRKQKITM